MLKCYRKIILATLVGAGLVLTAGAQPADRTVKIAPGGRIEIVNLFGRVDASEALPIESDENVIDPLKPADIVIKATSSSTVLAKDIKVTEGIGVVRIEVTPSDTKKRIDIAIVMPAKLRLKIETRDGEVRIAGDIISAEVRTDTGTIAADVPVDDLRYELHWTSSRPRFLSDFELAKVKEKAAGKFEIVGRVSGDGETPVKKRGETPASADADTAANGGSASGVIPPLQTDLSPKASQNKQKEKPAAHVPAFVSLNLTTARGIILLNIPPNEVTGDLRERPLTVAAKAIIRSGDSLLMEALRRAAPQYYGDYARTLPPAKMQPAFAERSMVEKGAFASVKTASVRVNDLNNRSVSGLEAADFEVTENNVRREVISVEPATAPANLVLLLDVSGSVDNYVNFIRKAARSFVDTIDSRDRISIVIFNDDVKVVSGFTTDKRMLSESLDTFDAGGATAYYDALAYTLADTLRPLKGERTAIVILTDGDDNRSFLPFDSMLASIQESGALIYPLYVPSGLIAASDSMVSNPAVDALRTRYLHGELTSKAKGEGERLAKVSGGVYYPITRLSQIQTAYDDIAAQLRTAYTVKFRSDTIDSGSGASPRLKVKVNKPNAFATVRSVSVAN